MEPADLVEAGRVLDQINLADFEEFVQSVQERRYQGLIEPSDIRQLTDLAEDVYKVARGDAYSSGRTNTDQSHRRYGFPA